MKNNDSLIFGEPINEVIKRRKSVRSYEKEIIDEKLREKFNTFFESLNSPFDGKVHFKLIDANFLQKNENIKLGTYGIIKGASTFIVSACENNDNGLFALGYELEMAILYATSLGLGTCWLGGTFNKGNFAKAMQLDQSEILPIVSPLGYGSVNRRFVDSIMRKVAGSDNRKPWSELFYNNNFDTPLTDKDAEKYATPLEMVRLAPSASNKQPWRIVKHGDSIHFYISHTKGYSTSLGFDMQKIDMGIGMCHFDLAVRDTGIKGHFNKNEPSISLPDENLEYIMSWTV